MKAVIDKENRIFDKNAFTIVGSPTITDGGIMTPTTDSYVNTPYIHFSSNNTIDIKFRCKLLSNHCYIYGENTSNGTRFEPYPGWSVFSFNEQTAIAVTETLPENEFLTLHFHYSKNNSYVEMKKDNETSYRVLNTHLIVNDDFDFTEYLRIGNFRGQTPSCEVDLSKFSITVDGKEVFNGSRPTYKLSCKQYGFDINKFKVVGSPTITDGGIASGFSDSNYLKLCQLSTLKDKSWRIEDEVTVGGNLIDYTLNLSQQNQAAGNITVSNNGLYFSFSTGAAGDYEFKMIYFPGVLITGQKYKYYVSFDISTGVYTLGYKTVSSNTWTTTHYTPITTVKQLGLFENYSNDYLMLGYRIDFYASLPTDLKQFSITVDDKEVFNGLKNHYYSINRR